MGFRLGLGANLTIFNFSFLVLFALGLGLIFGFGFSSGFGSGFSSGFLFFILALGNGSTSFFCFNLGT